jgi:hypothetical protein
MPWTCGLKKLKSLISHIIFSQLFTTILENTLNKPFCLILTWSLKNLVSINKLHLKCSLSSFKTQESLTNLRNHSTTFSKNVKEDLSMKLS